MAIEDLTGKRFGRLTVVEYLYGKNRQSYWRCICDCGKEKITRASSLKAGLTRSCGCFHSDRSKVVCSNNFKTHQGSKTRLFKIWVGMKKRCFDVKEPAYVNYGGRGITICDDWKNDFVSFRDWALNSGYEQNLTIDRIDNNGDYEPSNCKWSSAKEQANNRRSNILFAYKGKVQNLKTWCEELSLNYKSVWSRIRQQNKSFEDAIKC